MATSDPSLAGSSVVLRSQGWGRLFQAGFLGFWLCGWAVGEVFVLKGLVTMVGGALGPASPGRHPAHNLGTGAGGGELVFVGSFMLIWLTFWTIGGIAAMREVVRVLWAVDRFEVESGTLLHVGAVGPFVRRRRYAREELLRLALRRRGAALVAETRSGPVVLSTLGSREERERAYDSLRALLALPEDVQVEPEGLPPGWEQDVSPTGATVLRRSSKLRASQARVAWAFTALPVGLLLLVVWSSLGLPASAGMIATGAVLAVLALLVGWGAAWLTWGRDEWVVGQDRLERLRGFPGRERHDAFEPAAVVLDHHADSDGDDHFTLVVRDPSHRHTLLSRMNDSAEVVTLAHWLAGRIGQELTVPRNFRAA
jgi:hypothetical protein